MTPAEGLLWARIRRRAAGGFRFRRQQPVGPYIADFFCSEARLILEVDGDSHDGREGEDQRRQRWLECQGYTVLRFANRDVYDNLDGVLEVVWRVCNAGTAPLE